MRDFSQDEMKKTIDVHENVRYNKCKEALL